MVSHASFARWILNNNTQFETSFLDKFESFPSKRCL